MRRPERLTGSRRQRGVPRGTYPRGLSLAECNATVRKKPPAPAQWRTTSGGGDEEEVEGFGGEFAGVEEEVAGPAVVEAGDEVEEFEAEGGCVDGVDEGGEVGEGGGGVFPAVVVDEREEFVAEGGAVADGLVAGEGGEGGSAVGAGVLGGVAPGLDAEGEGGFGLVEPVVEQIDGLGGVGGEAGGGEGAEAGEGAGGAEAVVVVDGERDREGRRRSERGPRGACVLDGDGAGEGADDGVGGRGVAPREGAPQRGLAVALEGRQEGHGRLARGALAEDSSERRFRDAGGGVQQQRVRRRHVRS
mmetsp:Transcript_16073/g.48653  ORF Transcript_16073/g.48653 Transcript_16073/m.48653 type:complete len:303 (-) Transcript_16073:1472-2380(-)